MTTAGLVRLAIRVRAAEAEIALARLLPVLAAGAEERAAGDAVEYAVYGEAGSLPSESDLRELAGDTLLGVESSPVPDGWETAWHAHLGRVRAGGFAVRPPWVPGEPDDLIVDPGTAFGAGGHPTTRMCLELLAEAGAGGALCDWGTGSGVLAIAAARLGFAPVLAVDVDPVAVELARRNAEANGVAIEVACADVTVEAPWGPVVVANLTLPLLEAALPARPPERMIASGLLAEQELVRPGMVVRERRELEGWAAIVLEAA